MYYENNTLSLEIFLEQLYVSKPFKDDCTIVYKNRSTFIKEPKQKKLEKIFQQAMLTSQGQDGSKAKKRGRRPILAVDTKQLALAFASAVIVPSSGHYVARKGSNSPFHALQTMLPEVYKSSL